MRKIQLPYLVCASILCVAFLSGVVLADATTTSQAAAEAKQQPVVAPVPSGTSAADPNVSSASPADEVNVSTAPVVSTNSASGGN
jgi:hypothetical protein